MIDALWFILTLAAVAVMLAAGVAFLMARALVRPPRMTDAKATWLLKRVTPLDLGLAYEPLDFIVRDEATGRPLRLAAWWIPGNSAHGRCIVLIHGYTDAKVGAIAFAPTLHELGWNILALDMRAHGESEGAYVTGGCDERRDVAQVLDDLRARRPADTRQVVLFGLSLGATIAAAVANLKADLDGVILESPPADERRAISVQYDLMGMPGRWLQRIAIRMARWMSGSEIGAIRPLDLIERIPCPLMLILGEADPFLSPADIADIEAAIRRRADAGRSTAYWRIPEAGHLLGLCADPDLYRSRIREFLGYIAPS